jgi:hypothetical protein
MQVKAQEPDSLETLEDSPATEKVTSHFKSTRVINTHSVEMLKKGNLDFRILHRFGRVNGGIKQFFGLDEASMRMSFDYGLSDNVMIGIGRSTFRKELDAFIKTPIVRQATGTKSFPFTLVAAGGMMVWTEESFSANKPSFSDRSSFYGQLLMSRKFNNKFSLQLNSILLHQNFVVTAVEKNTIISAGIGARYKVSNRVALMADYNYVPDGLATGNTQPLSLGVDIETGGHVFQLHFSNAVGMNERAFLTQTTDEFFKGDIRFGFNLSRIFQTGRKRRAAQD